MVLSLKRWKSRSPPGFAAGAAERIRTHSHVFEFRPRRSKAPRIVRWLGAGWSSPVARQAHNLKVAGSNPAPATNAILFNRNPASPPGASLGGFFVPGARSLGAPAAPARHPVIRIRYGPVG